MIELLTPEEMAKADQLTIDAGTTGYDLMEVAGQGVADLLANLFSPDNRILVLAGPGNNGGDGFVAARLLHQRGYRLRIALLGEPGALKGDAQKAFADLEGRNIPIVPLNSDLIDDADVVVDALFGAGLIRDIQGVVAEIIEKTNASKKPLIAVDLPSGVNGATGQVQGAAFQASATVTFFRRKPGHLLFPGRELCGPVKVVDIGIQTGVLDEIRPATFKNGARLWERRFPVPGEGGHKYDRGHAVVFSGPIVSTGAARLCAGAALRSGAGLVTLASPPAAITVNATHLTSVMLKSVRDVPAAKELLSDKRFNAVALGPGFGIGEKTRDYVSCIQGSARAVILDADALTSFADHGTDLFEMIKSGSSGDTVLTPHEGEFSRLFLKIDATRCKLDRARMAAQLSGAIIVLKGADTVIASPDGRAAINDNAPPWLATAGSGDVLSGIICGMMAQSVPAFDAACMGVWMHGAAAQRVGPGLVSEDLSPNLRHVIKDLVTDFQNKFQ
ncbi:MAG: NAD(P)H-hydrate dehydratase [Stappiaceae bacterium]